MVKPPTVLGTKLTWIFYHELINQSRENDRKKRQIERNLEKNAESTYIHRLIAIMTVGKMQIKRRLCNENIPHNR